MNWMTVLHLTRQWLQGELLSFLDTTAQIRPRPLTFTHTRRVPPRFNCWFNQAYNMWAVERAGDGLWCAKKEFTLLAMTCAPRLEN